MTEDVTDVILNLKGPRCSLRVRQAADAPDSTCGVRPRSPPVTSRPTADVEILNKDLHIATLNAKGRLAVDLTVDRGGYLSAGRNKTSGPSASSRSTPSSRRCGGSPSRSSRRVEQSTV